ncbi:MAG: 3'-5' exonuclease, partial [Acidimicrobiales bacterium]
AVLVRTNAQAALVTQALGAAGIPCRSPATGALLDHPAVRSLLEALRTSRSQPAQMAAADLRQAAADLRQAAADAADGDDPQQAGPALEAVARLARDYMRLEPAGRIDGLLAWLPTAGGRDSFASGPNDGVTVSSFHRAKGLEWAAVWLCGLEQGLVPIGHATTPAAEAEERRLLYVAMTRARSELRCSWAETRSFGGRPVERRPSPWLATIPGAPGLDDEVPQLDAAAWRDRLAEQRRRLRQGGDPPRSTQSARGRARLAGADRAGVEALRSWRTGVARASGVPAHVVLHDRSLEALASLRPATPDELLAVPGLGPVKAARYGSTLLSLLARPTAGIA